MKGRQRIAVEVGKRFGRLVVLSDMKVATGPTRAIFQCDCGNIIEHDYPQIAAGKIASCGCLQSELTGKRTMAKFDVGQRYGRWTVMVPNYARSRHKNQLVLCRCECGNEHAVQAAHLRSGASQSCGCLAVDRSVAVTVTHGMSKSSEYGIWSGIIDRCENPSNERYTDYGGRGITMCPSWRHSFSQFFSDMGPRPPKMSIDRVDNSKGYSPDNCRWATDREQVLNRDKAIVLTLNGETRFLADWCVERGLNYQTAYYRMKSGAPAEEVLLPGSVRVSHKNRMPGAVDGNAA